MIDLLLGLVYVFVGWFALIALAGVFGKLASKLTRYEK